MLDFHHQSVHKAFFSHALKTIFLKDKGAGILLRTQYYGIQQFQQVPRRGRDPLVPRINK
jgi:hypothetical protein